MKRLDERTQQILDEARKFVYQSVSENNVYEAAERLGEMCTITEDTARASVIKPVTNITYSNL